MFILKARNARPQVRNFVHRVRNVFVLSSGLEMVFLRVTNVCP